MKQIAMALLLVCLMCQNAFAADNNKWSKKYSKSIFHITTLKKDGSVLRSGYGFYVNTKGEAVADYQLFRDAYQAKVTDAQGKEWNVSQVIGADDLYAVVRFQVNTTAKTSPIPLAEQQATVGTSLWVMPFFGANGNVSCKDSKVQTVNRFGTDDAFAYYTFATNPVVQSGCPVLDDNGKLVGVLQQPAQADDKQSYAVDARYCTAVTASAFALKDHSLKNIHLPVALPSDFNQAMLFLLLAHASTDSVEYVGYLQRYAEAFPKKAETQLAAADFYFEHNNAAAADAAMQKAFATNDKPEECHYAYSKMMYQWALLRQSTPFKDWTLAHALQEADKAYALNPLPTFVMQKGDVLYAMKEYGKAHEAYLQVCHSAMASAKSWAYAAQAKKMDGGDAAAQLVLLDSAVNTFAKPYTKEAASYLLLRANTLKEAGKCRDAVKDYSEYEHLMFGQLTPEFYFQKHKAEMECHMYQQALDDMMQAANLVPNDLFYQLQCASLQLRLSLFDEALSTAERCLQLDATSTDALRVKGVALLQKGKTKEGTAALQKAQSLGDKGAVELISKYANAGKK